MDSPLAVDVTEVFRTHSELFDEETNQCWPDDEDLFGFSRLHYVREEEQKRRRLNDLRTAGHHHVSIGHVRGRPHSPPFAQQHREDPRNTVLITGFQAENTLGSKIVETREEIPIFGDPFGPPPRSSS